MSQKQVFFTYELEEKAKMFTSREAFTTICRRIWYRCYVERGKMCQQSKDQDYNNNLRDMCRECFFLSYKNNQNTFVWITFKPQ